MYGASGRYVWWPNGDARSVDYSRITAVTPLGSLHGRCSSLPLVYDRRARAPGAAASGAWQEGCAGVHVGCGACRRRRPAGVVQCGALQGGLGYCVQYEEAVYGEREHSSGCVGPVIVFSCHHIPTDCTPAGRGPAAGAQRADGLGRPWQSSHFLTLVTPSLALPQVVGLLLTHNAQTAYKNAYGNTALSLATGQKAQHWIKRVAEGGQVGVKSFLGAGVRGVSL